MHRRGAADQASRCGDRVAYDFVDTQGKIISIANRWDLTLVEELKQTLEDCSLPLHQWARLGAVVRYRVAA